MTVDSHDTADPPIPGGTRRELIRGTLTLSGGTASETISLKLSYSEKPYIAVTPVGGSTAEAVDAQVTDDDPTSDGDITVRLDGTTDEAKDYHVQVESLTGDS